MISQHNSCLRLQPHQYVEDRNKSASSCTGPRINPIYLNVVNIQQQSETMASQHQCENNHRSECDPVFGSSAILISEPTQEQQAHVHIIIDPFNNSISSQVHHQLTLLIYCCFSA